MVEFYENYEQANEKGIYHYNVSYSIINVNH
jgi:hypothetical protein